MAYSVCAWKSSGKNPTMWHNLYPYRPHVFQPNRNLTKSVKHWIEEKKKGTVNSIALRDTKRKRLCVKVICSQLLFCSCSPWELQLLRYCPCVEKMKKGDILCTAGQNEKMTGHSKWVGRQWAWTENHLSQEGWKRRRSSRPLLDNLSTDCSTIVLVIPTFLCEAFLEGFRVSKKEEKKKHQLVLKHCVFLWKRKHQIHSLYTSSRGRINITQYFPF